MNKPILIDLPQRSQAWLNFREGKIGASDAAAIMGVSPWKTKLQLWEEKVLGVKQVSTPVMERGTKYEEEALIWFMKQVGDVFIPTTFQSEEHPDIIASLDGWNGKVGVEIKIPSKFSDSPPSHYMPQLQHQMMVMGTSYGWYCEYQPDCKRGWYAKIERDEDYIQELLTEELAFLTSMLDMTPPEPSDKDWVVIDEPKRNKEANRYRDLCSTIKELESQKEECRKALLEGLTNPRVKCGEVKMQKIYRKGVIDYAKLIIDHGITDAEDYRKPGSESWRIN